MKKTVKIYKVESEKCLEEILPLLKRVSKPIGEETEEELMEKIKELQL